MDSNRHESVRTRLRKPRGSHRKEESILGLSLAKEKSAQSSRTALTHVSMRGIKLARRFEFDMYRTENKCADE